MRNEMEFRALNETEDIICDDYIRLDEIKSIIRDNIDFSDYIIDIDGVEVIPRGVYHKLLLLNDEFYINYVSYEILTDIDKYGYYANEEIEHAIMELCGLADSDLVELIDDNMLESINTLDSVSYKKAKKRTLKKNKRVEEWKNKHNKKL